MPLMLLNVANAGFIGIDVASTIPKSQRGHQTMQYVEVMPERTPSAEDWDIRNPGDFENAFYWKHSILSGGNARTPRGVIGAWIHAVPAMEVKPDVSSAKQTVVGASGASGAVAPTSGWLPLETKQTLDKDFEYRNDVTGTVFGYGGTKMPGKAPAVLVATTGHGTRDIMAFYSGGPLVAQHEGPDSPQYSRHVYDIDKDGNLDVARHAGLHGPFRVRAWVDSYCQTSISTPPTSGGATAVPVKVIPSSIVNGSYAVLFNASDADDSSGYLGTHFSDAEAVLSKEKGGPLWRATNIHSHGKTKDGLDVRAGAMWMDMLLNAGDGYDMPWAYEMVDYVPATDGVFPLKVHFRRNMEKKHDWCGNQLPGRWDWEVFSPVTSLPPCTGSRPPAHQTVPPTETHPPAPPVYTGSSYQGTGMMFQPRVGVLQGQPVPPPVYTGP